MPYDHVAVIPDGPDAAASLAILQVIPLRGKDCCSSVGTCYEGFALAYTLEQVPEVAGYSDYLMIGFSIARCCGATCHADALLLHCH